MHSQTLSYAFFSCSLGSKFYCTWSLRNHLSTSMTVAPLLSIPPIYLVQSQDLSAATAWYTCGNHSTILTWAQYGSRRELPPHGKYIPHSLLEGPQHIEYIHRCTFCICSIEFLWEDTQGISDTLVSRK